MKHLKERQLAQKGLIIALGFGPSLADIVPLESGSNKGIITDVLFTVKGCEEIEYRSTGAALEVYHNHKLVIVK